MSAVDELHVAEVPLVKACHSLDVSRASYYRYLRPSHEVAKPKVFRTSHRALCDTEREAVLDVMHQERFIDSAPAQVHATLLEEGTYLCSTRTIYRILASQNEVCERRPIRSHPKHKMPMLKASGPNEVWSWDITKLKGPSRWTFFHLYVIIDMFSRHVVGWMVADREDSDLARELIATTCDRQGVIRHQLTLHSDRGPSMTSKTVTELLSDLKIIKSLSRPRVSNDNAYSESQFKTLKYRPDFPETFTSLNHAREFLTHFFEWYANTHKHSGIAMLSPAVVHAGNAGQVLAKRQSALDAAYSRHPERFSRPPETLKLTKIVELNPEKISIEKMESVE